MPLLLQELLPVMRFSLLVALLLQLESLPPLLLWLLVAVHHLLPRLQVQVPLP
jgi:hypothetical protein